MSWRFIPFAEYDGAMNMAIDSLLLDKAVSGKPVLRLYGFKPSCITLGLSQKFDSESARRVKERGFDLVRRPSGGRAVLHHKDLTYAFVAAEKGQGECGVLAASVSTAYKQICQGLRCAFEILGLETELGNADVSYRHLSDCFLATTNADLHFRGRKMAGSAQVRRKNAVLQHGSIPLNLEQGLMSELLVEQRSSSRNEPIERHTNLFEALGRTVGVPELNAAIKRGFERAFAVDFLDSELTAEELNQAIEFKTEFEFDQGCPAGSVRAE